MKFICNKSRMGGRKVYLWALVLFFIHRIICLIAFPLQYTDSDQTVMWQAALDMAHLEFHHPFWYGQLYSSNLESAMAVPLIWAGLPVWAAIAIITSLMSALPVWLFASLAARRQAYTTATAVLLVSLIFPVHYWQTTLLSRGFIQGIFCVSIGLYILFASDKPVRTVFAGFLVGAGLLQNVNAVFLVAAALPAIAGRQTMVSRVAGILTGAAVAWLGWTALQALAARHPEYTIHSNPSSGWSFETWKTNLQQLDTVWGTFFMSVAGGFAGGLLTLSAIWLAVRPNKRLLAGLILLILMLLLTAGFNKTSDGTISPFFSYARFYLSLPYALLFLLSQSAISLRPAFSQRVLAGLLPVAFGLSAWSFSAASAQSPGAGIYVPVFSDRIANLRKDCADIKRLTDSLRIGHVLSGDHYMLETVSCGCPGLTPGFPKAFRPKYERRQWWWADHQHTVPGRVLYLDGWNQPDTITSRIPGQPVKLRGGAYVLNSGTLDLRQIMQRLFPAEQFQ